MPKKNSSKKTDSRFGLTCRLKRPNWMWRWHLLISGFVVFAGVGMILGAIQYSAQKYPAVASSTDNIMGWIWSDPAGWFSVNSDNPGACASGSCGSYGVNVNPASKEINGFAWSDVAGWVCFGSSCSAHVSCNGTPPAGILNAYISGGVGTAEVFGWAKVCNAGAAGWISLNCADTGSCASVAPYYRVVYNPSTGFFKDTSIAGTSFGWNGNTLGTGFGYLDFSLMNVRSEATDSECNDGLDNNLNGLTDCQETSCGGAPNCTEDPVNGNCDDGVDNNFDGIMDCQVGACQLSPDCSEDPANGNKCEDGLDDDGDGLIDCMDAGCSGYPTCAVVGEAACGLGLDACCSDGIDNDTSGVQDCDDTNCYVAPICTPVWLQAKFGNVYAQKGITGETPKPGQPLSSATYCLTTQGAITGFQSQAGCEEAGTGQSLSLPKGTTGYTGTLGSLDINGIYTGRYGKVIDFTGFIPDVLEGKVYKANGVVNLGAKQFQNGIGATQRGNGLLIIEGDLYINGNLSYQTNQLTQYLRNLASFGVIVKKRTDGTGGNIYIDRGVTEMVGAFFAENTIYTGTSGGVDVPLRVYGLIAAYRINLERNYKDPNVAAETVIFDGRAVANPPPGMQEISKSLPTSKDAF